MAKKSKQNVTPARKCARMRGKKMHAIVFHFPRNNASGRTLSVPNEVGLKLVIRTETMEVKAIFDLQKVIDPQGTAGKACCIRKTM
jgi:hypothetical protein